MIFRIVSKKTSILGVTLGIKFVSSNTVDVYINGARVLEEGKVATLSKNITHMSQLRIYSKRAECKICNLDFDNFKIISYKEDVNIIIDDDKDTSPSKPPFDFIVSGETVINDLKKANPNNKHPRILINQGRINEIKAARTSNKRVNEWAQAVIKQADEILSKPISKYEIPDGRRLNAAKDIKKYIEITGMAYLLTDKQVYLDRAIQEINAAIRFQDWNDSREFLNTATIMSAMAIAYDWFYDDLDDALKINMRKAIIKKGLNKGIEQINNGAWWSVKKELDSNWNAVCNSGIIMSALAIGDEESEVSGKALERAITSFGKGIITEYGPDGVWGEGPTYWQYALEYIALGLGTLNSALGQDYDISKVDGLNETAHYIAHVSGPQGIFNYGDSPSGALKLRVPELFYLGKLLNDDSITKLGLKMLDDSKKKGGVYDLIWYNTSVTSKELDLPLDVKFRDPDLALMRGSWIDPFSTYIGFKAGKAYLTGIFINGKPLDGFNSQVRSYTYTIPYGTTDVPIITGKAPEGFDVEVVQAADNIVTPIEIKVTDKNNSKSRTHYTVLITTESLEQLPKGAKEVKIIEATARTHQDPNIPQNTLDDDYNTRWSAQGEQWIQFDLGLVTEINMVGISFSKGNVRSSIFDIEVSKDGINWKKILNGKSRGTSLDFEYFTFLAEEARYVRVNGKGNTSNDWNSYTSVKIY